MSATPMRVRSTPFWTAPFERLRLVAMAHDARLRSQLTEEEAHLGELRAGLDPG